MVTTKLEIEVGQYEQGIGSWDKFVYDLCWPDGRGLHNEVQDVIREVLVDDIYSLQTMTSDQDVWTDIGSHVGLFSIAAMQAGARISFAVDVDEDVISCAATNILSFWRQSQLRGSFDREAADPSFAVDEVTSASEICEIAEARHDLFFPHMRRCIKIDIQGAEANVFDGSGLSDLANAFDLMVFEWHQPDTAHLIPVLESNGWKIEKIASHEDVLLGCKTSIIWTTSG